jgi:hypothetical protein
MPAGLKSMVQQEPSEPEQPPWKLQTPPTPHFRCLADGLPSMHIHLPSPSSSSCVFISLCTCIRARTDVCVCVCVCGWVCVPTHLAGPYVTPVWCCCHGVVSYLMVRILEDDLHQRCTFGAAHTSRTFHKNICPERVHPLPLHSHKSLLTRQA